jgi:hypothetical protein
VLQKDCKYVVDCIGLQDEKETERHQQREEDGARETGEGWPLWSVETSAIGSRGVHMKEVLPCLVR